MNPAQYSCGPTENLAQFAVDLRFEDIPSQVVSHVKVLTEDAIGLALLGSRRTYARSLVNAFRQQGGRQESTVIGLGDQLSAQNAALLNGSFIHGTDWDDTHLPTVVHGSGVIIPCALALAECMRASGKEFLTAVCIGFEAAIRVSLAVPDALLTRKGFHVTGTCGVFGSALAASKLFQLDLERTAWAMGIAGSQASGILQCIVDGTDTKCFQAGWAAHNGIVAALFAREGFTGPKEVLEGEQGFYSTHVGRGNYDVNHVSAGLGSRWEIERIALKPYPCGVIMHGTIEAAKELFRRHHIQPKDIAKIECRMVGFASDMVFQSFPGTTYGARFNVPFAVAVALLSGDLTSEDFTEDRLRDPDVRDLASKVVWADDPESDFPAHCPGHVVVTTHDGHKYEHREAINRGHPDRPMSRTEVEKKYKRNAQGVIADQQIDKVSQHIGNLELLADICDLVHCLY